MESIIKDLMLEAFDIIEAKKHAQTPVQFISILCFLSTFLFASVTACSAAGQNTFNTFPSSLPPIEAALAKNALFSQSAIPLKPPSNEWKNLPTGIIGKWARGTQYRIYKKDFKTGQVDTSRTLIYSSQTPLLGNNSLEQTFEFTGQQDRAGQTWLFVGVPLIKVIDFDPGIKAYNCLIENKPVETLGADFAVKQRIYTTWIGIKSQKVLSSNRDLSFREFKLLPNNQILVVELSRSYQENGMPMQDEIHETILSRVSSDPHSPLLQANNVSKPSTDDLFKQFQLIKSHF
ncbi:MAG: hypothetical protein P4L53_16300 [Candidatus Obscuribacterales bacterium]|nr:hypothetical protein [Candidatus Obscuribacterales bacterium]